MGRDPRVVAELGRPETAAETAARKAESSRVYRSSQTTRNLIAALLVTLGIVLIIVLGVPRGEPAATEDVDVAAAAMEISDGYDRAIIVPDVPDEWRVNAADVMSDTVPAWTIVLAPGDGSYIRLAQAFDADETWAAQVLRGAAPVDTLTIEGITWDVYEIADPESAGNVAYALGTQAGGDHVLIYGSASPETTAAVAASVADEIDDLTKETS